MARFPVDVPLRKVMRALEALGFQVVREGNHIAMSRLNDEGTRMPSTMPNHRRIKSATLRRILKQSDITRDEFLKAYDEA